MSWHSNAKPPRRPSNMEAAVQDAITRLGGWPDSRLDGEDGLAAATMRDRERLERGVIAERDRLKARHAELMRLADRAERRRKASHEGSQLIAMARELESTIATLTALVGDGQGLEFCRRRGER